MSDRAHELLLALASAGCVMLLPDDAFEARKAVKLYADHETGGNEALALLLIEQVLSDVRDEAER